MSDQNLVKDLLEEMEGGNDQRYSMQPGPMQPGSMQPGPMQPGPMQPGPMQPGSMQPGSMQPGSMQPGSMQPGHMQPGHMQPGHMQPGYMPESAMHNPSSMEQRMTQDAQEAPMESLDDEAHSEGDDDSQPPMDFSNYGMEENDKSFVDRFICGMKEPIIIAILYMIISMPVVNTLIMRFLPQLGNNSYVYLAFKTLVLVVVFSLLRYLVC